MRMASPCAACRFATCKFPNLKKKILGPPPPKSWGRPCFNISILEHDLKYSLEHVKPEPLSIKRQSLVQCLHELLLVKGSQLIVNGFISKEIDDMITFICSK